MRRGPSDLGVRRALGRHMQSVAETVIEYVNRCGVEEAASYASGILGAAGWESTRSSEPCAEGLQLLGTVLLGHTRMPAASLWCSGDRPLRPDTLRAYLDGLPEGVRFVIVACPGRVDEDLAGAAASWSVPVALYDLNDLADMIARTGVLVEPAGVSAIYRLDLPVLGQGKLPRRKSRTDRRGKAKRLFRWRLEQGPGERFCLHGEYQPQPELSFRVDGDWVPPSGDFAPVRRELHETICLKLAKIFPDLPMSRIRTKAWAGVHKVFPARVYGRKPGEE